MATSRTECAINGNLGLTKLGANTLTLTGASTYSGDTLIKDGTLEVAGGDNRLPTGTTVTLGDAANNTSGILQLGDGTTASNQTLAALANDMDYQYHATGNRVVGGGSGVATLTLDVAAGADYQFDGILGGGGTYQNNLALTMIGTGTEELGGVNRRRWDQPQCGRAAGLEQRGPRQRFGYYCRWCSPKPGPDNLLFVDPAGLGGTASDKNPGTISSPFATLTKAVQIAKPGDTIIMRGARTILRTFGSCIPPEGCRVCR